MAFWTTFLQYVIEMIVLGAVGFCGIKIGIQLRKNKTKKEESASVEETEK